MTLNKKKKANYKLATTLSPLPTTTPLPPYHPSPLVLFLIIFLWKDIIDKNYPRYFYLHLDELLRTERTTIKWNLCQSWDEILCQRFSRTRNIQIDCEKFQKYLSNQNQNDKPVRVSRIFSRPGSVKSSVTNFKIKIVECEK